MHQKIRFIPMKIHKTVTTRAAPFGPDMHQIVCRLGLRPSAPPDPLAGLRGPTSKGRDGGKGGEEKGQRGGLHHDDAQGLHQGKSGPAHGRWRRPKYWISKHMNSLSPVCNIWWGPGSPIVAPIFYTEKSAATDLPERYQQYRIAFNRSP